MEAVLLAPEEHLQAFSFGGKPMNNEENILVMTSSELRTQLQSLDDHVILTIILEGDDEEDAKE